MHPELVYYLALAKFRFGHVAQSNTKRPCVESVPVVFQVMLRPILWRPQPSPPIQPEAADQMLGAKFNCLIAALIPLIPVATGRLYPTRRNRLVPPAGGEFEVVDFTGACPPSDVKTRGRGTPKRGLEKKRRLSPLQDRVCFKSYFCNRELDLCYRSSPQS